MAVGDKKKRTRAIQVNSQPRKRPRPSGIDEHYVSIDDLAWQEVAMPDRLDDVEGFMGMEEIEGVVISRTGKGGLECKVINDPRKAGKKAALKKADNEQARKRDQEQEQEWKGIDNDIDKNTQQKAGRKHGKHKIKSPIPAQAAALQGFEGNSFAPLPDEDEDVFLPAWDFLGLSLPTLRALSQMSFAYPTPIQSTAIPEIIAGHDLIGKASTGSGKTLAFGIPMLEYFLKQQCSADIGRGNDTDKTIERAPLALVLSPTRELAHQLHSHLTTLAAFTPNIRIVSVTGGLSIQKQLRQLTENGGADIIVATPGRLWEVVSERQGWIERLRNGLKFLVVDEADRLLQEGHYKEVVEILNLLSNPDDSDDESNGELVGTGKKNAAGVERQTLVFSATFHKGLQQKLVGKSTKHGGGGDLMGQKESMEYLLKKLHFREKSPKFVDVNPTGQLADRLSEGIIECGAMEKDLYLYYLLLRYPSRTLIFTNSISSTKRLAPLLATLQLPVFPLHSRMIQKARMRALERFSSPATPNSILIATDVAARGLDIQNVDMVIHYHLPRAADMYVHRSGRAARGIDAKGVSVLLCSPDEVVSVRRLAGKVHESDIVVKSTGKYMIKEFNVNRKLVNRLKPRVELAKKITDSSIEKQRKGHEDEWLKTAAEELGVDYDFEDFRKNDNARRGRQGGKLKKDKAASATKDDLTGWKAQLSELLKHKVNSGFSEKYLTSGNINLAHLLFQAELGGRPQDGFLGLEDRTALEEVSG